MQLKIEPPKQEPLHILVSQPSSEPKIKKSPSESTYKSQIPGDRLQVQTDPIQTAARRLSYKERIRMMQFKDTQMKDDQTPSGIPQVQAAPIQTETRRSSFKEEIRLRQFKETKAQDDETPGDIPFSTLYWEASEQSDGEEESPLITEGVSSHQSQITQTSSSLDATEQSEDEEESPREAERVPSRQSKLTQTSSTSIFQRTT
ncbi:uncharacterized protein LOC123300823 [Chrysoperla carnea]|uniref:uncharacterized protein LOC123300823 n=1 Tax=Chrysoperla carnea TaxID=189513 RepID=UPI001D05FFEC|nr:uncharacterized protein LOC123300823 [Chrysoperla carnea]